jgi:hypothetical protein
VARLINSVAGCSVGFFVIGAISGNVFVALISADGLFNTGCFSAWKLNSVAI